MSAAGNRGNDLIGRLPPVRGHLAANTPLGRASDGSDIAWMTVYLCGDQGNWITGQSINVDGGAVVQH